MKNFPVTVSLELLMTLTERRNRLEGAIEVAIAMCKNQGAHSGPSFEMIAAVLEDALEGEEDAST